VTEREAAEILLVRAVEEGDSPAIPPEAAVDAVVAAGEPDDAAAWFGRRARHLLEHELAGYGSLLRVAELPSGGWVLPLALPFAVGLAANYLGPQQRIHVLANPIVLLILWNLFVYGLLLVHAFRGQDPAALPEAPSKRPASPVRASAPSIPTAPTVSDRGWLREFVLQRVLAWWLSIRTDAVRRREHLAMVGGVTHRFTRLWLGLAGPQLGQSMRRVFHLGAIGLTFGAIVGMYLRGLFFDYAMVWRSTFVTDPDMVATVLGVLVGPACLLAGQSLPTAADASALLTPAGVPAGWWIHLYALSAALLVVLPRALLAASANRGMLRARHRVTVPFDAPYFHGVLDHARRLQVKRVRDEIHSSVTDEIDRLAEGIATLVCDELFDHAITDALRRFREEGGTVTTLERELASACAAFQPTLADRLPGLLGHFEGAVLTRVEERLGRRFGVGDLHRTDLAGTVSTSTSEVMQGVSRQVGAGATDLVGVTVTGAVGAVAAIISGGIGHHLGLAIVAALLHTSGPVGLLIGGVAGLLVAGVGWWQGREQITDAMKDIPLPGAMVRLALWSSRFERLVREGRSACGNEVRAVVRRELGPLTTAIAEQIWTRVRPVLGSREPAGVGQKG
jgi:Protein of unknown function (DUF2868)